jgi:predicted chitinase
MSKTITALVDTKLKARPVQSSELKPEETIAVSKGATHELMAIEASEGKHDRVVLEIGRFYAFREHWQGLEPEEIVTREQVRSVYGSPLTDAEFADLTKCLKRFEITTPERIRHFLSQTAHESGGLRYLSEIWGPTPDQLEYEWRTSDLGNCGDGDGYRFRGAGPIQLTGRGNYQRFADKMGDQRIMEGCDYVVANYLFCSAGSWWEDNDMNALIDGGADVYDVSCRVNGRPPNGVPDRQYYYDIACQVIN